MKSAHGRRGPSPSDQRSAPGVVERCGGAAAEPPHRRAGAARLVAEHQERQSLGRAVVDTSESPTMPRRLQRALVDIDRQWDVEQHDAVASREGAGLDRDQTIRSVASDLGEERGNGLDCSVGVVEPVPDRGAMVDHADLCDAGCRPWRPAPRTRPGHHWCRCSTTARTGSEGRSSGVAVVLDGEEVATRFEVDRARPHGAVCSTASRVRWPRQNHDPSTCVASRPVVGVGSVVVVLVVVVLVVIGCCRRSIASESCVVVEQAESEELGECVVDVGSDHFAAASRRSRSARSRSDRRSVPRRRTTTPPTPRG